MRVIILALILSPALAFADGMVPFGGLGLTYGTQTMSAEGSESKFSAQGYVLEGGIDMSFGDKNGIRLSGEVGKESTTNSVGDNYLEMGSTGYYAAKASLFFSRFAIGGGYRNNDVEVKSMSSGSTQQAKTKYEGFTPFGFMNMNFDIDKRYRATIEAQYITGTLTSDSAVVSEFKYSEISASIRFFILFN